MFNTLTKAAAFTGLVLGASFVTPTERVEAFGFGSSNCGGLNQKTCVHILPSKRCNAGLIEKRQRGRNICIRPATPGDTTGGCGGLNENSCWSLRASKWCDPGLIYKPTGIPGKGRCRAPDTDNMVEYTRAVASRFKALGRNNEFTKLRNCLISPARLVRLKREMKDNDTNGTNSIIRECDVDIDKLQDVASFMFNGTQGSAARSAGVRSVSSSSDDWDDGLAKKFRLTIEFSAAASAGSNSAGGTIGYAIPLHKKPQGSRWYKGSDDYKSGFDLGAGADILIGIGMPGVPGGNNATESGRAGIIAAAVLGKLGMMTRITDEGDPMWALFGGAGLGATIATFAYENEFFVDR
jgi:hypothetical protein